MLRFTDRAAAGRRLAAALAGQIPAGTVVLGLARGGVPVAAEVARAFGLPLDVMVALKLGVPGQPELAAGAVAEGVVVLNDDVVHALDISQHYIDAMSGALARELEERQETLRAGRPPLELAGRSVLVVDDGIASGATLAAAVASARRAGARHVTAAAPVAPRSAIAAVAAADRVLVVHTTDEFRSVSDFYDSFPQVTDAEVRALLG
jgi:putative phosphoribosyl transferase